MTDYYSWINFLLLLTSISFFLCGLDDVFVDLYYWVRRVFNKPVRSRRKRWNARVLRAIDERFVAVMIPAWKESDVIASMVECNIGNLEYSRYVVFIGVYVNDPETNAEVDALVKRFPNVRKAIVPYQGPTCKADCLNWIIEAIFIEERKSGKLFDMIVMHDAEDVVHPLELKLFNYLSRRHDFIQIPVRPIETEWHDFVAGSYMDEFAEYHMKDMIVRSSLCGIVPSAGVSTCFTRKAVMELFRHCEGEVFSTGSLTEDYDVSYKLAQFDIGQHFAKFPLDCSMTPAHQIKKQGKRIPIAVGEYFPATWWTAIRQKTRWNIGIFFQSAGQLTWNGSWANKYYFFRDRKGILVNILMLPAYFLAFNILCFWLGYHFFDMAPFVMDIPIWLLWANFFMMLNRLFQRFIATYRLYHVRQAFLGIPRVIVSNIVNFCSTLRAIFIYLNSRWTKSPIVWDKTTHAYPEDWKIFGKEDGGASSVQKEMNRNFPGMEVAEP